MKKINDIVATVGKYTDRQTGQEKKRYLKFASVFEDDEGNRSIKFDSFPAGNEWNGWAGIYAIKESSSQGGRKHDDDDIPF